MAARTLDIGEGVIGGEFDSHLTKRAMLTERFSFFPNLTSLGDYRFQLDTTFVVQMKAWLNWHTTFSDRYINYPPPRLNGDDSVLSTGLRVTWGKAKL